MKISGFTYVCNGINYQYPFLASIQSLLPIVDEMIVVVGDSTDGTRDAILALNDEKIKIVDSIWDEDSRKNGKIFAHQSNLGIEQITGDWAIHIQADEVLHENDIEQILNFINLADKMPEVDGLLFPFLHFWGDYKHIRNTRKTHGYEIRAFKNTGHVFSFHDSQGFRKYTSYESYKNGETGEKMKVINTGVPIYHYSYCRNPKLMKKKSDYSQRFWHNDSWLKQHVNEQDTTFDYNEVDLLEEFTKSHPKYMANFVLQQDWTFEYDQSKSTMTFKNKILHKIEKITGKRLFAYKNYKLVGKR